MTVLVIGVGNEDRGDDAVGPVVARAVRDRALPGVRVLTLGDPTDLLDAWDGADLAVVVDALRSGVPAGSVRLLEPDLTGLALPGGGWAEARSTHDLGVASAVGLGRALRRLPRRLVLVGVEGADYEHGTGLTPAVADAVTEAVHLVSETVAEAVRGREASGVPG